MDRAGHSPGGGDGGDGIVGHELVPHLLPYLRESVFVFDREGGMKARVGPPGGLLGYGTDIGSNVFAHIHPDDVPRGMQIGAEARQAQADWMGEWTVRLRHADGGWRRYEVRIFNRYDDPAIDGMLAVLREVDASATAGDDEPELARLGELLPTAYLALGHGGRIRFASEAATALLGAPREDLIDLPVSELVVDRDRPAMVSAYEAMLEAPGARSVLATTRTRFGARVVEAEFHNRSTDRDHKLVTVLLVDHDDVPELVRLATRDPLTGLANRTKVLETLSGLLHEERHEPQLSVVYVDLDDLKAINDQHGHEAGDRALIEIGNRLAALVRDEDLVGRMSGDEFVVVCPGLDARGLAQLVDRLGDDAADDAPRVTTPEGTVVPLTVSAGGASAVAGDSPASLLRRADEAMFAAKHRRA